MRARVGSRAAERRLVPVIAVLIATTLGSAVATLASQQAPAPPRHVLLGTFDVVAPTPIEIVFAKPRPPHRTITAVTAPLAVRAARVRDVTDGSPLCTGAGWEQRRGAAALASLRHETPGGVTIAFRGGRGALKGMTYYDTHHVDVYVGTCARESDALLRHVVAHELGHAWDSLHMSDALRARYLQARGIAAGTPWFGCDRCQDFATPAGDFAETYAQWQRGAADSRSTLAPPASPAELAQLGAAFFSA